MDYILDIDSSERNVVLYPDTNNYVINLNRTLYNVTDFKLISAIIPVVQPTINEGNRRLRIDGSDVTLDIRNYTNGVDLASNILSEFVSQGVSNISDVVFDTSTDRLTFSNVGTGNNFTVSFYDGWYGANVAPFDSGTPASVLGFNGLNVTSSGGVLISDVIDLHGPTSLILKVSAGSRQMKKSIYNEDGQSVYTGRILTNTNEQKMLYFNGPDDPLEYYFYEGPMESIDHIQIEFFYNNGTKLVPYDFGKRNHVLKFQVKCNLDKLIALKDQVESVTELPPPVDIPMLRDESRDDNAIYILLSAVLVIGLIGLLISRPTPRRWAAPGP
jgi:hypothetical protein